MRVAGRKVKVSGFHITRPYLALGSGFSLTVLLPRAVDFAFGAPSAFGSGCYSEN